METIANSDDSKICRHCHMHTIAVRQLLASEKPLTHQHEARVNDKTPLAKRHLIIDESVRLPAADCQQRTHLVLIRC